MLEVVLDSFGRLTYFKRMPSQLLQPVQTTPAVDWSAFFAAADVDVAQFQPTEPLWTAVTPSDARVAWIASGPRPLRLEGASLRGRAVYFSIIRPWTQPTGQENATASAREAVAFMESHDTVTVALAPQPGQPQGAAHVMYNTKMGMLMYEGEIAPAPTAKSYELWVIPTDGKPINAGVFNPITGRADHWMMKMPAGVEPKMFAVTLEPQGGMPQPTGPMVLVGHA